MNRKSIQNLKWLVLGAMLLTVGFPAEAQIQPARIGILGPAEEPRFSEILGGLKQGLGDHGYSAAAMEILDGRVARGDQAGARTTVERFVQQGAKVLFVIGSELARSARQVSAEIPIVFVTPGDPVASGLVSSLARPGSNMTAMTFEYPELAGKRLELLKEIVPRAQRVFILYDPRDASPMQGVTAAREAAPKLGLMLLERETRSREEITKGLGALGRADALLAIPGGLPSSHYQEMIMAANSKRLSTMFHARTGSTMDALASYGANDSEIARQAARLVDKILKGTNAGDIPVERPTKLEFILNLKTAKQIGLTIPPNVLARADKVIK
jgi:putative tryptophan/tyrosine transport system substrate-binding protein